MLTPNSNPSQSPQNNPRGLTKQQIIAHAAEMANRMMLPEAALSTGLLKVQPASLWMEQAGDETEARMLFGEFW
ncbi:MAG: hypothetical protein ACXVJG_21095, partial [Mucilaginibacter sp.]